MYSLIVTILVLTLDLSRSNDYSDNLVSSPWKAILLTYVVVGKAKRFITNQPMLAQAPVGFDSVWSTFLIPPIPFMTFSQVIGEASPTGSLNYDELVVYTNDAVRPAYLVMYGS